MLSTEIAGVAIKELVSSAGHCAWEKRSPYRILYDRYGHDGFMDMWMMDEDGSNQEDITHGRVELPGFHCGNGSWSYDSQYIVFQAQYVDLADDSAALPGKGTKNDLYAMRVSDGAIAKIYDAPFAAEGDGVLHPHFNPAGTKICFSYRLRNDTSGTGLNFAGEWDIRIGDFNGLSALTSVTSFTPGEQPCFYETHGFSHDGEFLMFSANLLSGQNAVHLDIWEMHIASQTMLPRRTSTILTWDEHAQLSPDGLSFIWGRSTGIYQDPLNGDWWIANRDGSNPRQLTFFNNPAHRHYIGRTVYCADGSWHPNGEEFVGVVLDNDLPREDEGPLYKLRLLPAGVPSRWPATHRLPATNRVKSNNRVPATHRTSVVI